MSELGDTPTHDMSACAWPQIQKHSAAIQTRRLGQGMGMDGVGWEGRDAYDAGGWAGLLDSGHTHSPEAT
jgi:hypothetical protein